MDDGPIGEGEFARWLTPMQARQLLRDQWDYGTICRTLASMVGHGLLMARAGDMIMNVGRSNEEHAARVPVHRPPWSSDSPHQNSDFWDNGRFDYQVGGYSNQREVACHGVRFDPNAVAALLEAETLSVVRATARRGAKRKDWWDHLWIEMIRRIQNDELKPKNVAELQEILETYAGNVLNEDVGDSTLKPMSSNLFKFLKENGGK